MSIPTNNLPTAATVTDDDTIVGNDGGETVGVTKQFAGTAFLRPEQLGSTVASQAAVDGKVSKSGDTMTDTLGVSGAGGNPGLLMDSTLGFRHEHAAPIQEIIESDQPANSRLWRKRSNSGQMAWQSNNDDGSLQRVFMAHNRDTGQVDFLGATSVTVPANSGTGAVNQAARITQRDPATGRLQIDGIEQGKTGTRDVSALLLNGWTAGQFNIQRTQGFVTIQAFQLSHAGATSDTVFVLPQGFRPDVTAPLTIWQGIVPTASASPERGAIRANGPIEAPRSGSTVKAFEITLPASGWPSALPGIAV